MDILGIGFSELLFIFLIALMVFGPRRLPEIAGKAGKFVRDLRNMSQGFLAEWQREITVATRLEELEQVRQDLEETKQSLRQTQTELTTGAVQIGQTLHTAAAISKPTSSPKPPAEKIAETSESTEIPHPENSTPPVSPPTQGDETVSASAEGEKKENSASPVPQPTPAAITPSEVVE